MGNNIKVLFRIALLTLIFGTDSRAASLYVEITASASMGSASFTGEASSPSMGLGKVSAGAGITLLNRIRVGAKTAYSFITQYSDPALAFGNRRGSRWEIVSPQLGFVLGRFTLQGDYQFFGDYKFTNADVSGNTITYKTPAGFEVELLYSISRRFKIGVRYESVSFSEEEIGTTTSDLTNKLNLITYGAVICVDL